MLARRAEVAFSAVKPAVLEGEADGVERPAVACGQAQHLPGRWLALVVGLLWMFAGIVIVALFTAQLTATIAAKQIRGAINGPADLPGKRVATLTNSTAVEYLRKIGAQMQGFQTADEMFAALLNQKVDAVLSMRQPSDTTQRMTGWD